jgi:hypothetical protein
MGGQDTDDDGIEALKQDGKRIKGFPFPPFDHRPRHILFWFLEGSAIYDLFSELFSKGEVSPF